MNNWNAAQYLQFEAQRTQPSIDLAGRIPFENPQNILDVGCGPGNSTAVLKRRFPTAQVLGIDSSEDMVRTAKETYSNLEFQCCDATTDLLSLGKNSFDIVFSNACLQWLPDHKTRIPEMLELLKPGGYLAIQTPMNDREPIRTIINELADTDPWAKKLSLPKLFHNLTPEAYFDLLAETAAGFTLWETTYYHTLSSHADILRWYRSTGLRPYLAALSPEDAQLFEAAVLHRVQSAYPLQRDGRVIFRFPRFFILAQT